MLAIKRSSFHLILIFLFALPIILLAFLDYFNIEIWSYHLFSQNFTFNWTWKGRMFYLFFLWLLSVESIINWENIIQYRPKYSFKMLLSIISALIPTVYVLAINFLGLNQIVLQLGEYFNIDPGDFIYFHWPLSCEYVVFAASFITTVLIAYKTNGLKTFSVSFAFLGGVAAAYMFDTIYPFGVFKPLQAFALPTAATTAAIFELLGYKTTLYYPVRYGESNLPSLSISVGGKPATVAIAWACAGVHSLLLYILIISVFFKKMQASAFRKLLYFVIGLFGTYFVNVFRIFSILLVILNYGDKAGKYFHDTYAELYFFTWMFAYMALIALIQRFSLVERIKLAFQRLSMFLRSRLKAFQMKLPKP